MCLSKGSLASSVDCVIGNRGMTLDTVWCLLRILKDGFFGGGVLYLTACRLLVPCPGIIPGPLAVEARSPDPSTTREVP